ncbi:hypothetical protein INP83_19190 [Mucilaginibacter sp. 21P]|uniref:hypothetical protein n=1 Tax=Mucilaginibacter sp. 21P TaxID=2778902 RepID=UPI001C58A50E|nr:hypothetical protein [Mucilaginibacter sp. 21P]QXV65178.1 hypothetical protein INP83_19190 [Mucilaginibacter sp. 21P]
MDAKIINAINEKFRAANIIDLLVQGNVTINGIPELENFFLGSGETIESVLRNGIASLRKGFYKIIQEPFYKTNIEYPTFAATVLYFLNNSDKLIKYTANIGPLTNVEAKYQVDYRTTTNSRDQLVRDFLSDKKNDDSRTFYYNSKKKFYQKAYLENKLFVVKKSGYSTNVDNYKEVHWIFLT